MAKAHLTLPNGTTVTIEGTPEEVHRLLALATDGPPSGTDKKPTRAPAGRKATTRTAQAANKTAKASPTDLAVVVNLIKTCDEAEVIETNILDRPSRVDRVLLPLYVLKKHTQDTSGLTSGEIGKITKELGVPVSTPSTSAALAGPASKYVMGDKVRKKGETVHYTISHRGVTYLEKVLQKKTREG